MIKNVMRFIILFCLFAGVTSVGLAQRCGIRGLPPCPVTPTAVPVIPVIPPPPSDDMDGDGTPDGQDSCPATGGPAWNAGCPLPDDADGDGTPDSDDACPEQGGPAQSNGCPQGNALSPLINLPVIDPVGPCLIATQSTTPVNIRQTPETDAGIVGALDPAFTYPASARLIISIPENNIWYAVTGGWVFAGVVRVEGDCSGIHTILQRTSSDDGDAPSTESALPVREIVINPDDVLDPNKPAYIQRCTGEANSFNIFNSPQTIIQCDDDAYAYDAQETLFECNGELLPSFAPPNDCVLEVLERETLEPDGNANILIDALTGAFIGIDWLLGYQPVGDDTPLPPSDGVCSSAYGVSYEGVEIVGFNPQPEPPPHPLFPVCMLLANEIDFGGEDAPAVVIPLGAGRGLSFPPDAQVLTQNEFIIIINGQFSIMPMIPPPPDIDWFEIQYSNDLSMIIGTDDDTDYICPVGNNGAEDVENTLSIFDGVILVGFNPQPEPPAQESVVGIIPNINIVGFNPQPEPPAQDITAISVPDVDIVGFNPQPEPPAQNLTGIVPDIHIVGFNPQPEPPAQDITDTSLPDIDIVGFNPQPEPPALCFEAAGI